MTDIDLTQSENIRLRMHDEDQILKFESRLMGLQRIIRLCLETIDNLIIAIELEADYPGERSREEITNAKALKKELVDLGF